MVVAEGLVLISTLVWQMRPLGAVLGTGLLIAVAVAWWAAPRRLRGVNITYQPIPRPIAGEEATLSVRVVANPGCTGIRILAGNPGRRGMETVGRCGDLDEVGLRVAWAVRYPRRGWQPLPSLQITSNQPFGLLTAERSLDPPGDLLVLPGRGLIKRDLRRRLDVWLEQVSTGNDPGEEEIARLRPYRPGDPPRKVHWRASAHVGELMVTERHAPTAKHVALCVDTAADQVTPRRLDRLAAIAVTLIDHLIRRGWQVSLHGLFSHGGVHAGREALSEALALIEPDAGDIPFAQCIPRGRTCLVITSGRVDPPADGGGRVLVLDLAECEQLVRLPRRLGF